MAVIFNRCRQCAFVRWNPSSVFPNRLRRSAHWRSNQRWSFDQVSDVFLNEPGARVFATSGQVKNRYGGVSDMTLWRWSQDPEMKFPAPYYFGRIRHWKIAELDQWDETRPRRLPGGVKVPKAPRKAEVA